VRQRQCCARGLHRRIAWSNTALPDGRGGVTHIGTGLDITERHRAEEEYQHRTHLLDNALRCHGSAPDAGTTVWFTRREIQT